MKTTVIVPTYRRSRDLARCLQALQLQQRIADEVIVTVRDSDTETWEFLDQFDSGCLPLKWITITVPGVVAAMNQGLETATGDIIAFTDDDAAPHPTWLALIEAYFLQDECIGAVGGRDILQYPQPSNADAQADEHITVGKLRWYGKVIGEHHRGSGQAREVDVLKGVNMSFRRCAIADLRFDSRMRGTGAQVHYEVAFCLALKRQGWKLIYDPAVLVDHYSAPRFDEDQRHQFNAIAFTNAVHNETLALLEHLSPLQRIIFLTWAMTIGTTQSFGIVQWLRYLPSQGRLATQKWIASLHGRTQGITTWSQIRSSSKPSPVTGTSWDRHQHNP